MGLVRIDLKRADRVFANLGLNVAPLAAVPAFVFDAMVLPPSPMTG